MPARILLTGASSFSGRWFTRELASRGHEVIATFPRARADYSGVREERVNCVSEVAEVVFEAPCGSSRLQDTILAQEHLDVVCLHHAVVGDYRSPDFDVPAAVATATAGSRELLAAASKRGAASILLTRSVFESGQGLSDDPRAIGLYAVAKTATVELWAAAARLVGMATADFTITNPFGPYEDPRFVSYLAKTWLAGSIALLRAPDWVRDNVPAPLLAASYARTVDALIAGLPANMTPSHLVATNLDYARRLGDEFAARWDIPCAVGVDSHRASGEPRVRIGTDHVDWPDANDAASFWGDYADFYATRLERACPRGQS